MKPKKFFCLLAGLGLFVFANAQYSGIDIYTGMGLPLYGEKSYPEKNWFIPSNQPCPPLTRPGYFTEGKPSFLLGSTAGYAFGMVKLKAGLSYTFYQTHMWANPDSALKYAIPICPDPYMDNVTKYKIINLPIGGEFTFKKFTVGLFYGFPILTRYWFQSRTVSGISSIPGIGNFWFYNNHISLNPVNQYIQFTVSIVLTEKIGIVAIYQLNELRLLNHITIGINYKLYDE